MLALYDERKVNQRTAILLRTERSLKTTNLKLILAGFYRSNTINRKQRPSSLAFQKIGNDADGKRSALSFFFHIPVSGASVSRTFDVEIDVLYQSLCFIKVIRM